MFGRKKKEKAKYTLMLFREGLRYWYAWLPLDEEGKISFVNGKRHDYYISCFETMKHTEPWGFRGDYLFTEKVSEESLRDSFKADGAELVGELPESVGWDSSEMEKLIYQAT